MTYDLSCCRCQFWEGGIGGVPGMEAHGGYTFCGLAALVILKRVHLLDMKSLLVSVGYIYNQYDPDHADYVKL